MASFLTYTLYFTFYFTLFSTLFYFSEQLLEGVPLMRVEKTSHLHFYFHDNVGGKNPTVIEIINPPNDSTSRFGTTMMTDNALTEGRDPTSKVVGRAQGMYGFASQQYVSLLMVMNFVFLEGKYNGSTITILGRNPVLNDVREMPIVGGSLVFRFARGYALAHTVFFNPNTDDAIVEYNVFVTHF